MLKGIAFQKLDWNIQFYYFSLSQIDLKSPLARNFEAHASVHFLLKFCRFLCYNYSKAINPSQSLTFLLLHLVPFTNKDFPSKNSPYKKILIHHFSSPNSWRFYANIKDWQKKTFPQPKFTSKNFFWALR